MGRPDGIRVRESSNPIYYLIPQFMPHRHDSMNMITVDIPVEPLRQYMNAKRPTDGGGKNGIFCRISVLCY